MAPSMRLPGASRSRRGLFVVAAAAAACGGCLQALRQLTFVPPAGTSLQKSPASLKLQPRLRSHELQAADVLVPDGAEETSTGAIAGIMLSALVVGVVCSSGAQQAQAILPPEEQQGYVQNAMGYANLVINFALGYASSIFAPFIREWVRPGPVKYLIVLLVIGTLIGAVVVVQGMLDVDSLEGVGFEPLDVGEDLPKAAAP
eukprot:TRINITY_DN50096_c0_g1_i1.p1 TRINITY_DN50096_c0_g1~~TRINITY_DN50096_c0_g1_i1.p1  ORF type:complete len:202 (-),score=64.36 TRINITY_DN50096_c0_g1_i1:54-659(-)